MHEFHPLPKPRQTLTGCRERRLVPVNPDETSGAEMPCDFHGMSAQTDRGVHVGSVRPDCQPLENLPEKYRDMPALAHR